METRDRLQMIEEIKRAERSLYLEKSKLASAEAMEYGVIPSSLIGEGLNSEDRKEAFCELMKLIEMHSTGGDSVEDIQEERKR